MKNLLWTYGETGIKFSVFFAAIGSLISKALGGYDIMIETVLVFFLVDILLGILAAWKARKIDSKVMWAGGANKISVLVFIAVAYRLDLLLAMNEPYIRTAVIWFYIGREGLSIVENAAKAGFPVPNLIKKVLEQLKDKEETN